MREHRAVSRAWRSDHHRALGCELSPWATPWEQRAARPRAPHTKSGVLPGTRTPSISVSSSSRRKVPQAGGYSLSDSLRTWGAMGRSQV